jgi:L-serine dehydratase
MYRSLADAIRDAEAQHTTISAVALAAEARDQGRPIAEIRDALRRALAVMRGQDVATTETPAVGCSVKWRQ